MKLTLSITKEELLNILTNNLDPGVITECLQKHFNCPELVWDWANNWASKLESIETLFPDMAYSQKISAIKELRTRTGIGLADAKYAVENWNKWFGFVKANDRLPEPGYLYTGILK